MHDESVTAAADAARRATPQALAQALRASRADTLATFAAFERALPGLRVPRRDDLNPPLWELGHIGWFQEYWLARNPQRLEGTRADPDAPRAAPLRGEADALYDSSRVPHDTRWSLPLPDADATRSDLERQLEQSIHLLDASRHDDEALYFHRLVLLHEDTHHEAALYMAQALGVPIDDARWQPRPLPEPGPAVSLPAGRWRLGSEPGGFAWDNELPAHEVDVGPTNIDALVLRWAEYLPFVEAGGADAPRYLRRARAGWQQWRHGRWQPLDARLPACHLTYAEALGWCRWAHRRLPTEAEWERAAATRPDAFRWGDVWEWSASTFAPYPGFVAHPYRDYSQPWFDTGRPVLRGASFMTQPRMRHLRYRNYFPPGRADVPAGLRSCAL
jgi:iron(II)-dependent oxidoreductase